MEKSELKTFLRVQNYDGTTEGNIIYKLNAQDKATEYISISSILIIMFFSSIVIYRSLSKRGKEGAKKLTIKSAQEEKSITAEYLLSYILPLFAFDFTLWNQVVLFLVFFLTLVFLCIRHNYYSVNIVLEAAGYRLFQCSLANSDNVKMDQLMISKQRLNELVGTDIYVLPLNNDYGLDVSANCKFQ